MQMAPSPSPIGDATSITHTVTELTLTGALIVAIRVLWASNQKKDDQILSMATKVTETMALVMEAVKELRVTTDEVGTALENLGSQVAALEVVTCPYAREGTLPPHNKP